MTKSQRKPIVGIIMGSDSDLSVMSEAAKVLSEFKIPFELTIVSAHRTPERMVEYAQNATDRGLKVIIAGAGGAAHLPGMVAALTTLPVIGVPVQSRTMSGLDSLYSIVQMPPGVPVATMAINGAKNAGLFAVKMLATTDPKLHQKVADFMKDLAKEVLTKVEKLDQLGYQAYLQTMPKK